jgi:hypothetical protein
VFFEARDGTILRGLRSAFLETEPATFSPSTASIAAPADTNIDQRLEHMHMCIVVLDMSHGRKISTSAFPSSVSDTHLRRLIAEAHVARRRRSAKDRARSDARALLDEALAGPLPANVDLAEYFSRVCTLAQLSAGRIETLMSAIAAEGMTARRARPLSVALVEMIYFVVAGVPAGELVTLQVAIARNDHASLVMGLAARGAFAPVATVEASWALQRAIAIVNALGAEFQRGVCEERMVLGVTYRCGEPRAAGDKRASK